MDTFLLMDQPADEKAMIVANKGKYNLKKNLPAAGPEKCSCAMVQRFLCSGSRLWRDPRRHAANYDEEAEEG